MEKIDKLSINNPYAEPREHWLYDRSSRSFSRRAGRRSAGYVVASAAAKGFDDPGDFVPIELVNKIRTRVKAWRQAGYAGVTGVTRRLLAHWQDDVERGATRFFFCQLEAIETLIWLTEAPAAERMGIDIVGDGGEFVRWCSKMATGSGKTLVMAMLIAWQCLNKVARPGDARFSKSVLVVAPGLTVKERLQVLLPAHSQNYYAAFNIVPAALREKLRQARVRIINWHVLAWETQDKLDDKAGKNKLQSVDKRKRWELSGEAYARQVLGEMAAARNLVVINDEAHHAWRVNAAAERPQDADADSVKEATIWVGGLDRLQRQRGILRCFDLSATPFVPGGQRAAETALFSWIVSDFGLNDAIESGLVKTPRVVIGDDTIPNLDYKSRLYHLYADAEVKDDLNRAAEASEPLPDLLINAYNLLGADWLKTKNAWEAAGHKTPPVMITVANRTETSARIKAAFVQRRIAVEALCDTARLLQVDSTVLSQAEAATESVAMDAVNHSSAAAEVADAAVPTAAKLTKKQAAEQLRRIVDSVGKPGEPGEGVQNVISVQMLSEGWDAKTVTHIMGLRAFSSQLLCEQVVGRGLRRVSYDIGEDGLFEPEYVNVFGVPFTFLPHEGGVEPHSAPVKPTTRIAPLVEKSAYQITWPNVLRVDSMLQTRLEVDWAQVEALELDPYDTITQADLAAIVDGKPHDKVKAEIGLAAIDAETRLQTVVFKVVARVYAMQRPQWKGQREWLLAQLVRLVEELMRSDKVTLKHGGQLLFVAQKVQKVMLILNMNRIVSHVMKKIRCENTESLVLVYDKELPIRSTADMPAWFTRKPCEALAKSHISHCVYDSRWEASEAYFLEQSERVAAFAKNDHLGFAILYHHNGVTHKYYPDFLVKLINDEYLVLETKGRDRAIDKTKREYLDQWVLAVNAARDFGHWHWQVSFEPSDLASKIEAVVSG